MDKSTLSNYGWIVIVTLVLAVMLALATPFGTYVGKGASNVIKTFVQSSDNAVDEDNIDTQSTDWDIYLNNDEYNHKGVIPEGGTYIDVNGNTYTKGDSFPNPQIDDLYKYGDYVYTYKEASPAGFWKEGWAVQVKDTTLTTYGCVLEKIANKDVVSLVGCFRDCANLEKLNDNFRIPKTVTHCGSMFANCSNLKELPTGFTIPDGAQLCMQMFRGCSSLTLKEALEFPHSVTRYAGIFQNCTNLTGTIIFNRNDLNYTLLSTTFVYTTQPIILKAPAGTINEIKGSFTSLYPNMTLEIL